VILPPRSDEKGTSMGLFDDLKSKAGRLKGLTSKAGELVGDNADKITGGIDKAADLVDDRTGGKHGERIDTVAEKAKGLVEKVGQDSDEGSGPSTEKP
jgi:hypothetical protein